MNLLFPFQIRPITPVLPTAATVPGQRPVGMYITQQRAVLIPRIEIEHCSTYRYPAAPRHNRAVTNAQIAFCHQFESLGLRPSRALSQAFQRRFHQNIETPWTLAPQAITQFRNAFRAFQNANPAASEQAKLNFILTYPLQSDGFNIQLDRVHSTQAYDERTANEVLRDHRSKCTGIAYVYAALLQEAGYQPHFYWRPFDSNGQAVQHLYVGVEARNGTSYTFDPLFYGNTAVTMMSEDESSNRLSYREVLAWHYNNEGIDFQWTNRNRSLQLLGIALYLDPFNPHISQNWQSLQPNSR